MADSFKFWVPDFGAFELARTLQSVALRHPPGSAFQVWVFWCGVSIVRDFVIRVSGLVFLVSGFILRRFGFCISYFGVSYFGVSCFVLRVVIRVSGVPIVFGFWDSGFGYDRFSGVGCIRFSGLGFGVSDLGYFRVSGFGCTRFSGFGFQVSNFGYTRFAGIGYQNLCIPVLQRALLGEECVHVPVRPAGNLVSRQLKDTGKTRSPN